MYLYKLSNSTLVITKMLDFLEHQAKYLINR